MTEIPPLTLAFLRFFFASFIVWPLVSRARAWRQVAKEDRLPLFLLGFFGVTTYFAFENFGLLYTSASHGALIIATIPLCTELYVIIRLRLPIKPMLIAASLTALAGVAILVSSGGAGSTATMTGDLLIFGAVASWVAYSAFASRLLSRYPHLFITMMIMVIGAVTLLPGALLEWVIAPFPFPSLSAWLGVAFLTFFCSVLGYHFWNLALSHLGVGMTNNFLYVLPLIGMTCGVVFLHEPLTTPMILGAVLIIGGVIWAHFVDSRREAE